MKRWRVRSAGPLRGAVRVPGDKSIGHRALIFASLAEGKSAITGLSGGEDNRATAEAFRAMGVDVDLSSDRAVVTGVGLDGLREPAGPIDCGNSGTTIRLLSGVLAAQRFDTTLTGDASLTRRPMGRIVKPLRARGAHLDGAAGKKPGEVYPPLQIGGLGAADRLAGLEYRMPVASAQVKSALLLSGLYTEGMTALHEPVISRDHTERMLLSLGVPLSTAGSMVVLDPEGWSRRWDGFEREVPGDISGAAFLVAAASIVPGSEVVIERVGTNPTRTGMLDVVRAMGALTAVSPKGESGNEPLADLVIRHGSLGPGTTAGETLVRMIDEVPALCAMAAAARGTTRIRDAAELRVKESDRIAAMAAVLSAFGRTTRELPDGLDVDGGALTPAHVQSDGDHRIAMASAVLGLAAGGESIVDDVACVDTSFPGFAALLNGLGADIVEEDVT